MQGALYMLCAGVVLWAMWQRIMHGGGRCPQCSRRLQHAPDCPTRKRRGGGPMWPA